MWCIGCMLQVHGAAAVLGSHKKQIYSILLEPFFVILSDLSFSLFCLFSLTLDIAKLQHITGSNVLTIYGKVGVEYECNHYYYYYYYYAPLGAMPRLLNSFILLISLAA